MTYDQKPQDYKTKILYFIYIYGNGKTLSVGNLLLILISVKYLTQSPMGNSHVIWLNLGLSALCLYQ